MILIFGGAYQGKLDYAKKNFDIKTVCDCSDGAVPDFAADAIYGIDGFVKRQSPGSDQPPLEAADWFSGRREAWQDKVLIMTDVSQGIVPTDPALRAFREMNGRLMLRLAAEASEVHRVFCGIGKRVK
ncbi:MAG: bifunctional adenosylcobinamide kinase/adenosylcobinamide-phosphate guanylyltransferase [Clostridia bacterium]